MYIRLFTEASGEKTKSRKGKGSSSKDAADSSRIDLNADPSHLTDQVPDLNIPIDTERKRRSRQSKGSSSKNAADSSRINLNASPSRLMDQVPDLNTSIYTGKKGKSQRGVRNLNNPPFQKISKAAKEGVAVMHTGFGNVPNVEIEPVEYNLPITKQTLDRFKASFEHFRDYYNVVDPSFPTYFPDKFDHSETHGHAAPSFPPNHECNLGGHGSFVHTVPSFNSNPETHFVGYGTHGYAPPFAPHFVNQSGGSGTSGHADPRFHQWGNYGGPGSSYEK